MAASQSQQPVTWNFNHEIFQRSANQPRRDVSMIELYRQRAQQLRDSYDYIILAYSGGADSDQMLRTFLTSHIPVDEVWCDWPHVMINSSDWRWDGTNADHNIHMEYLAVVKPTLDRLRQYHPEIHIHQSDSFSRFRVLDSQDHVQLLETLVRYHSMCRYDYINEYAAKLSASRGRVAIVMGIDKCMPDKRGADIGFVLRDDAVWSKDAVNLGVPVRYELFYWTPDMPAIVVQQAHLIWDILKLNPEQTLRWLNKTGIDSRKRGSIWFDDVIKWVCYPHWDRHNFQVAKTSTWHHSHYARFYPRWYQERFHQAWASMMINGIVRMVDPTVAFRDGRSINSELKIFTNFIRIGSVDW